jgi:hypothetical protein
VGVGDRLDHRPGHEHLDAAEANLLRVAPDS